MHWQITELSALLFLPKNCILKNKKQKKTELLFTALFVGGRFLMILPALGGLVG